MNSCLINTESWCPSPQSSLVGSFSDDLLNMFDCKYSNLFLNLSDTGEQIPYKGSLKSQEPLPVIKTCESPSKPSDHKPESKSELGSKCKHELQHEPKDSYPHESESASESEPEPEPAAVIENYPKQNSMPTESPSTMVAVQNNQDCNEPKMACDDDQRTSNIQIPLPSQPQPNIVQKSPSMSFLMSSPVEETPTAAQQPRNKSILRKPSEFFKACIRSKQSNSHSQLSQTPTIPIIIVTDEQHPSPSQKVVDFSQATQPLEPALLKHSPTVHPKFIKNEKSYAKASKRTSLPDKLSNTFGRLQSRERRRLEPPFKPIANDPSPAIQRGWPLLHKLIAKQ